MTNPNEGLVVLVAEDETLVRLLANDILSDAGYRVLEARDGQEALTILEVHDDVRALFTDVNMPHVDGLSLAKIVSERWPDMGIVVTSGAAAAPEGYRFLPKPYNPESLLRDIEAVVAGVIEASSVPVALTIMPIEGARPSDAGGLAHPLAEPDK
jgi:two-component system, response regulator PdtaR